MGNHPYEYERNDERSARRVGYSPRYTQNDIDRNSRYSSSRADEEYRREARAMAETLRRSIPDRQRYHQSDRFSAERMDSTYSREARETGNRRETRRDTYDSPSTSSAYRRPGYPTRQQDAQQRRNDSQYGYDRSRNSDGGRASRYARSQADGRSARYCNDRMPSKEYQSASRSDSRTRTAPARNSYAGESVRGRLDNRPASVDSHGQALHARPQFSREQAREGMRNIDKNLGSMVSTKLIIGVLAALLLVALLSIFGRTFLGAKTAETTYVTQLAQKIQTISGSSKMSANEVANALEGIGVDATWADKAGMLAQTDARFQIMAMNSEKLGREGTAISDKLVKLAVNDPKAIDYVVGFIDKYPQDKAEDYNEAVTKGTVPLLFQWDPRWGYLKYSGTTFGCTGCGPTAMSMVYMGLTGKNDMTPADMADYANANGFETDSEGTLNGFFAAAAESFGLSCTELEVDSATLVNELESGSVVVCNVGSGDFTTDGHFIVITGVTDEGELTINDPYSSVNSEKTWDPDTVIVQTKALYTFKKQ